MKYLLLHNRLVSDLEAIVESYLATGWELYGDPIVTPVPGWRNRDSGQKEPAMRFAQAVVLKEGD